MGTLVGFVEVESVQKASGWIPVEIRRQVAIVELREAPNELGGADRRESVLENELVVRTFSQIVDELSLLDHVGDSRVTVHELADVCDGDQRRSLLVLLDLLRYWLSQLLQEIHRELLNVSDFGRWINIRGVCLQVSCFNIIDFLLILWLLGAEKIGNVGSA